MLEGLLIGNIVAVLSAGIAVVVKITRLEVQMERVLKDVDNIALLVETKRALAQNKEKNK